MKKIFILFLLAQVACLSIAKAQTSVASPYSGYGLGDQIPYAGTHIQGMAQATTALSFTNAINVYNPASYSSLLYTTLDGGAFHNTIKITDGVQKQTNYATSFSHILLGFPVSKHWGAVIGLVPFTGTGYNIKQKEYQQGVGTVNHIYQGSGNISQIVFGNAVKLGNHFF